MGDAACALLERRGYRCWIAPRDILPGKEWGEAIVDGIRGARLFVLIFSANANDSPQVRREVERAVHHRLPIVPFRIEDVSPAKSLEYFMSAPHWLDALTPPLEKHLDYLAETVGRLTGEIPSASKDDNLTSPSFQPQIRPPIGRDFVQQMAVALAFAAVPLLATLSTIEPPWPAGIGYLSAAIVLAASFVAPLSSLRTSPTHRWSLMVATGTLTLAGLLAYLLLYSLYVESIPRSNIRLVKGFVCTTDALLVHKDACPDLPRDALRDAEWEATVLWTRSSVAMVRISLVVAWLAFVAGLTIAAGVVAQRMSQQRGPR